MEVRKHLTLEKNRMHREAHLDRDAVKAKNPLYSLTVQYQKVAALDIQFLLCALKRNRSKQTE